MTAGGDMNADVVRGLYAARASGDFEAVARLLADDIVWHEPGAFDYSDDHVGKEAVLVLLRALTEATSGTFKLTPGAVLTTREYAVTIVHWSAERGDRRAEGDEVAVYRLSHGRVAEAWFFPEITDAAEHDAVFTLSD
jgi:ketosteroid isomerase-like protein